MNQTICLVCRDDVLHQNPSSKLRPICRCLWFEHPRFSPYYYWFLLSSQPLRWLQAYSHSKVWLLNLATVRGDSRRDLCLDWWLAYLCRDFTGSLPPRLVDPLLWSSPARWRLHLCRLLQIPLVSFCSCSRPAGHQRATNWKAQSGGSFIFITWPSMPLRAQSVDSGGRH